jgi:hypothetical protein
LIKLTIRRRQGGEQEVLIQYCPVKKTAYCKNERRKKAMEIKTTYEKPGKIYVWIDDTSKIYVWIDDICVGFGIGKEGAKECRALADELKEDSTKAVLVKKLMQEGLK